MSRSLYSVVLTDEVVNEIDRLALRRNTNRSNLINQILAEYVSYVTPEMRINSVFRSIEEVMNGSEIITAYVPQRNTMSLKSIIDYRYRPTVKYDVELFRAPEDKCIGRLSVTLRTQSGALIEQIDRFFKLWRYVECRLMGQEILYSIEPLRITRAITARNECTPQELARAIAVYVDLMDKCMKGYLSGTLDEDDIAAHLRTHILREALI